MGLELTEFQRDILRMAAKKNREALPAQLMKKWPAGEGDVQGRRLRRLSV